jgi:hypothetical protein
MDGLMPGHSDSTVLYKAINQFYTKLSSPDENDDVIYIFTVHKKFIL